MGAEKGKALFFPFAINNGSLCKREISNRFGRVGAFTERSRAHGVYLTEQRTCTKAEDLRNKESPDYP